MKCQDCKHYKLINDEGLICNLAQEGKISEIDDPMCLMRCQISLLRSIWEELAFRNGEGEDWKF